MNTKLKSSSSLLQTYAKYGIEIVKGKGSCVWDGAGKKYLDFYGGHAVCLLGHCPKPVVSAIAKQAKQLMFYSNIVDTLPAEELSSLIAGTLSVPYSVYFANSGSEANETALKIARKHTGKKHIIAFRSSFHGRAIAPLAVTGIDSYHRFEPNLDSYTSWAELGDMESVKKAYAADTAAVICEPIQSIGGVNMAPQEFYRVLADFCAQKNILLIFDEVQTGLGRTGSFWFSQSVGVHPDLITTAKGIASGLPLSVVLIKEPIARTIKVGEHAATFGGGPVVCAAGVAVMKMLLKNDYQVSQKEATIRSKLEAHPAIQKVLGKGLLLGIQLKEPRPEIVRKALTCGLLIGNSYKKEVLRIFPPLSTTFKEIDLFAERFLPLLSQ
ncbi:aminotransferase class III-fold pyridoxal phosphate-dependent enzyme [Candidatus Peregrinibacteria bacterium]|nr:aminotransferase class III-fold pyridoxal phosphate-dependent enzyme [Candidatus Peregrinibacteria bacterium]